MRRTKLLRSVSAALAVALAAAAPALATGFHIFEQGTKALGMSNAFTAQADDPSAMYFNVAGLAFQKERRYMAGVTLISLGDSEFTGADPFPGSGIREEQKKQLVTPPHLYWVEPINDRASFGLGVESPFGLVTEWDDPDNFTGRFISERAELISLDINPSLGFQATDTLGLGIGLIGRAAKIELDRRVAQINPFTLSAQEVAAVNLESDFDTGFGFNVGLLHKPNDFFSWGLSYRSAIEIDFGGDGRFTQRPTGNATFDGLVAAAIPFGQDLPIETSIEFPDQASLGLAFRATERLTWETDLNWMGWSTFDRVDIRFSGNPQFDSTIDAEWGDSYNIRTGFDLACGDRNHWRFGAYFDETPQPDPSVGPLLPDADRFGISAGFGRVGERVTFDLALLYIEFEERSTSTNDNNFNGTYESSTLLLGGSLSW